MKTLNRFILTAFLACLMISCKDDEPSGPAGALGKSFNLVFDQAKSSIVYSLAVSPDGSKIIASMQDNNTSMYYSSDGGKTFDLAFGNTIAPRVVAIDNQGNILTQDNRIVNTKDNNAYVQGQGGDVLIIGDNGKVFAYNLNAATIKQRSIANGDFAIVTPPSTPAGGISTYVLKAAGKGLLYIESSSGTTPAVKAWMLNESTLQWSSPVTFTYEYNTINGCNNLNRLSKFVYVGSNIIMIKGCTGVALLDLSNSNTTYVSYPEENHLVYEDLRDGQSFVDSKKQLYVVARSYDNLTKPNGYRYDGTKWAPIDGFLPLSILSVDQSGNIYFNSSTPTGKSLKGLAKLDVSTGTLTGLELPGIAMQIDDAAESDNQLLLVTGGFLYKYDMSAMKASQTGLNDISHINVLSDGRWLAGGTDHLYLSNDKGKTWVESKNIFSSLMKDMGSARVMASRIVNNKLIINGVFHYYYYNSALGMNQDKYNNIMIEFNGTTSSKLDYQFPGDFTATTIGPDGKIYGDALYVDGFGIKVDRYALQPGTTPERSAVRAASPQVITDSGLQMTVGNKKDGSGYEVVTRNGDTEEFQSTNTTLPGGAGTYVGLFIRQAGDRLIYIRQSEAHMSAN